MVKQKKMLDVKFETLRQQHDELSAKATWTGVLGNYFYIKILLAFVVVLGAFCLIGSQTGNGLFYVIGIGASIFVASVWLIVGACKLAKLRAEKEEILKEIKSLKEKYEALKTIPEYDERIKY